MKRRIYLTSRFGNAASLRLVRDELERHGHKVTSTWIDVPITAEEDARRDLDVDPDERAFWAHRDIVDIFASDTFVLIDPSGKRGGCYVELGLALAYRLDVIVVGARTNVFTYLCTRVASVDDLPLALSDDVSVEPR